MSKNLKHRVLVYGTLKNGYGNNRVMFRDGGKAEFVSRAITREKLYVADGGFPMATRHLPPGAKPDVAGQLVGEVWAMNDIAFANCDKLEGHPNFYTRQKIRASLDNGGNSSIWIYLIENPRGIYGERLIRPNGEGLIEWKQEYRVPRGWEYADA